ncbi:MAG: carboxymuconolactone decarboxylase family protein [Rhodospirillaceae bacterium]|jgi:4-carboxymuconolactone decarboxylase|nr:carboxymuconolactone decarboxylase family protein [Rhodospirillaceae bacterium]
MSRLPPIDRESLNDAQAAVLDAIESGPRGKLGLVGPFGVYVRAPGVGQATQAMGAAVRYGTELAEKPKEVAICTVGAFFHSKFEFAAHTALAAKAGVAAHIVESLRVGKPPVFEHDDESIAYDVARALLTEHRLSDELYAQASATLGQTQLIELVVTVGYYSTVSLTLNTFEIPLSEGMMDPFPDYA